LPSDAQVAEKLKLKLSGSRSAAIRSVGESGLPSGLGLAKSAEVKKNVLKRVLKK